jgi:flagellar hook-associated protein 3 FlgL
MLSSLDPASLAFLNGLNQIQARSLRAQQQLTSGRRINSVSDAPSDIPLLVETQSELNHAQQINQNLASVKAEVDGSQSAVASAEALVERAQSLGTQGQSGFVTAESRQQIAQELGGVLQQLVGVADTSIGGRNVFSGDSDQTVPYTIDLTKNNPISAYGGTPSTRQVELPDGTTIPVAKTAQDLFDSPNAQTNVFQSINNLRLALLNNDQAGIDAALPTVRGSGDYLNSQLSFYGQAQNQVDQGATTGATLVTQLQTRLSGIQDADLTQSITEFTQANTAEQAALSSRAKLPRGSLFDYLG